MFIRIPYPHFQMLSLTVSPTTHTHNVGPAVPVYTIYKLYPIDRRVPLDFQKLFLNHQHRLQFTLSLDEWVNERVMICLAWQKDRQTTAPKTNDATHHVSISYFSESSSHRREYRESVRRTRARQTQSFALSVPHEYATFPHRQYSYYTLARSRYQACNSSKTAEVRLGSGPCFCCCCCVNHQFTHTQTITQGCRYCMYVHQINRSRIRSLSSNRWNEHKHTHTIGDQWHGPTTVGD